MLKNLFYFFLNLTFMGSVTAAAVLLLRLIFNKSINKSVFVILWIVVLFRLAIPLSIPSPTSVFNLFNNNSIQISNSDAGIVDLTPRFLRENFSNDNQNSILQDNFIHNQSEVSEVESSGAAAVQHVIADIDKNTPQNTSVTSGYSLKFSDIAAIIWLAGMVVLVVFGGAVYFLTLRKIKKSSVFEHIVLDECKQSLKMKRRVKMLKNREIESPFVYGIYRPKIILPESVIKADNKSLTHILIHELVHIKHFDNLLKLISSFILCIHWYNPIVWLSYILMQRDIESSCDEKVLAVLGYNAKGEYAFSLYEFASRKYSIESAGFTSFGEISTKSRISNILNYKKNSAMAVIISFCIIASILAGCATNPLNSSSNLSDEIDESFYDSKVAYVADDGLYYVNLNDGKNTLLVKGTDISTPVFSENGKVIAFKKGDDLYGYNFSTYKEQLLLTEAVSYCAGKDASFYASSQNEGILLIDAETAQKTTVVSAEQDALNMYLKLSPDSKKLAFYKAGNNSDSHKKDGAYIYDTISKKATMIVQGVKDDYARGKRPVPGKWSPDSSKLFIWLKSMSGSISADGVEAAVYDFSDNKLVELNVGALAYDENITFADSDKLVLNAGGNREMYINKYLKIVEFKDKISYKIIKIPDKVTTTPCYSSDGKRLLFAASPAVDKFPSSQEGIDNSMATFAKRQIYMYIDGKFYAMTDDEKYRSEAPVFLKNNNCVIFVRVATDKERSIWIIDSDGKNQRQIAGWKYSSDNTLNRDYYGRIQWNTMYDIYDDTKVSTAKKIPSDSVNLNGD